MLHCSISGQVPEEPVISTKSGLIFEKRLIIKAIESNNNLCPVTNTELKEEDLVALKTLGNKPVVQPRPPSATSISSLLRVFQEEWDALLLEHYQLQKHVATVRQELSHALYQHDAACRVIARITQERDKARTELAETRKNMTAALAHTRTQEGDAMDVDKPAGITQDLVEKIIDKAKELQKWRKNRAKKPEGLATKTQLGEMKEISTNSLHSPSDAGILSMALHPKNKDLVFTGGQDSKVLCWNRKTKKVAQSMGGHKKKVLVVRAHKTKDVLLTGSADRTVRIWSLKSAGAENGKYAHSGTYTNHKGAVNDIHIHPMGDYFVSCSDDSSWAFHNLLTQQTVQTVAVGGSTKYNCLQLHPDGRLLGTGSSKNTVQIWELHNQNAIVTLDQSTGPISSISFSENGYHLAASSSDGSVYVWDLRKTNLLHRFDAPKNSGAVNKVCYDNSGQYLLCAGKDLRVYQSKQWNNTLVKLTNHSKDIMDCCWGPNAQYIASVGKDRQLKFYSFTK